MGRTGGRPSSGGPPGPRGGGPPNPPRGGPPRPWPRPCGPPGPPGPPGPRGGGPSNSPRGGPSGPGPIGRGRNSSGESLPSLLRSRVLRDSDARRISAAEISPSWSRSRAAIIGGPPGPGRPSCPGSNRPPRGGGPSVLPGGGPSGLPGGGPSGGCARAVDQHNARPSAGNAKARRNPRIRDDRMLWLPLSSTEDRPRMIGEGLIPTVGCCLIVGDEP